MEQVNQKKLLVMSVYAGEIMLKNGAETYRVEDTIVHICKSRNYHYVDAFVTPTGIFVSVDNKGLDQNEMLSSVKRIKSRNINLDKVARVNDFSRKFVEADITVEEGMEQLREIDELISYPLYLQAFMGGIASAFVALLFGANQFEFISALITSILVTFTTRKLGEMGFTLFLNNILGGSIAALFAILFSYIHPSIHVDRVIIGAIMVMVPGVAMTNAVRDSIMGDLVSGLARGAEALLIAISIAFGVGFVLQAWILLNGGSLL